MQDLIFHAVQRRHQIIALGDGPMAFLALKHVYLGPEYIPRLVMRWTFAEFHIHRDRAVVGANKFLQTF